MSEAPTTAFDHSMEEGDQETVTLGEVLQSEEQLMEDVNAVLGAIDDKTCTYTEGYMKRQALYSCLTCIPESRTDLSKCAGVCLACCYNCHEGHELIELYTKRNFRCDCGNSKFPNLTCTLHTTKSEINDDNQYNQNFTGLYCTCKRPYPDSEDTVSDEMIQCIICEDWFHTRHLGVAIPPQNVYAEMCCEACIKEHQFLLHYDGLSVTNVTMVENSPIEVDVVKVPKITTEETMSSTTDSIEGASVPSTSEELSAPNTTNEGTSLPKPEQAGEKVVEVCRKPKRKSDQICSKFWTDIDWRRQLCTCPECFKMYETEKVLFLIDPLDTVHVYEEKGKERAREYKTKQEEANMKYLNSLNRVPLLEAIAGYNDLKENLVEYLKKFAENKKVVREEDIKDFFSKFDSKKKPKCEVPHYCR